ncbi:uncharacterized protein LOC112087332 [Eutrema salsugineum]|uniref:uncharacterized protein LOC112087332 n=1 Tax=Eutrema salsugineum TaxID=72664 RepID=UPI000CECFA31|nr:uncharacterized protein LOC112087332 [Eutrema salsugineum]
MLVYRENVWCDRRKRGLRRLQNGWLVTKILRAKGFEFSETKAKPQLIDEGYLSKSVSFEEKVDNSWAYNFKLLQEENVQVLLPNRAISSLQERCNVSFILLKDQIYNPSRDPPLLKCKKEEKDESSKLHDEPPAAESDGDETQVPPRRMGENRYHFDPYVWGSPDYHTRKINSRVNGLQQWCKWQDKTIHKLVRCVRHLKKKVKKLTAPASPEKNSETSRAPVQREDIGERVPQLVHLSCHLVKKLGLIQQQPFSLSHQKEAHQWSHLHHVPPPTLHNMWGLTSVISYHLQTFVYMHAILGVDRVNQVKKWSLKDQSGENQDSESIGKTMHRRKQNTG